MTTGNIGIAEACSTDLRNFISFAVISETIFFGGYFYGMHIHLESNFIALCSHIQTLRAVQSTDHYRIVR